MPTPNIKPTHKPIKTYYAELKGYEHLGEQNEGTVRAAFQGLLQHYCRQSNLTLLCEKTHYTQDDLHVEASKKFAAGYPPKNIVIQSPTHALLYQHGELQLDLDITEPRNLVRVLQGFFAYADAESLGISASLGTLLHRNRADRQYDYGLLAKTGIPQYRL